MGVLCLLSVCTSVPARVTEHRLTMSHSFERNSHFYWVPYASRLEAIASRLEAISIRFLIAPLGSLSLYAIRLEAIATSWKPFLLGSFLGSE